MTAVNVTHALVAAAAERDPAAHLVIMDGWMKECGACDGGWAS
jgi:hypothetical protein